MKTRLPFLFFCISAAFGAQSQTITTTTISGSLRVNDSLRVLNNINSNGDITSTGEMVAKDTMRAEKDVIVDGNAVIGHNLRVNGTTSVERLFINPTAYGAIDPCLKILMTQSGNGGEQVVTLTPTQIAGLENAFEQNPCPTPPVVPFTWQTYGNHVNSNQRWIGTIENYDFNIKTNSTFQVVCKANGDIGLGAFGGNAVTTTGKKYRLFIANSGEISAGVQDVSGKYPFVVKPNGSTSIGIVAATASPYMLNVNGAVNIGTPFPSSSSYMLTVNGRIGAREIKVSIQNPWPDYVFEKEYQLKSLEEVKDYIAVNKHLPGVPEAKCLEEEACGLDIGQMQAVQMEKIEEIYLHLIELSQEIKELKKENAVLKERINN